MTVVGTKRSPVGVLRHLFAVLWPFAGRRCFLLLRLQMSKKYVGRAISTSSEMCYAPLLLQMNVHGAVVQTPAEKEHPRGGGWNYRARHESESGAGHGMTRVETICYGIRNWPLDYLATYIKIYASLLNLPALTRHTRSVLFTAVTITNTEYEVRGPTPVCRR